MNVRETVTKLRTLIADARALRGLPPAQPIDGLDAALQHAQELRVRHALTPPSAPYSVRRNRLLARVRYLARAYGLQPWVDDFVAASDAAAVTGLDPDGLEALVRWLERCTDVLHSACDWEDTPPAR